MNAQRLPWTAQELIDSTSHRFVFDDAVHAEVSAWLESQPEITADDVTVSDLAWMTSLLGLVNRVRQELLAGTGVARIHAPSCGTFDERFLRRFFLAFGVLLGKPLGNYGRLYDVKDRGGDYTQTAIPVSQTRAATGLHTDSSARRVLPDLVGLICIRSAKRGGESRIACAIRAYERLRNSAPELLKILERPHLRDIVTPGADQTQRLDNQFPVFEEHTDRGLVCRYMRFWIEKGYEKSGVEPPPNLNDALDALDRCLEEEGSVAHFHLEPGESLWVDNTTTLHDRTAFDDDAESPRLLLRQWVTRDHDHPGTVP